MSKYSRTLTSLPWAISHSRGDWDIDLCAWCWPVRRRWPLVGDHSSVHIFPAELRPFGIGEDVAGCDAEPRGVIPRSDGPHRQLLDRSDRVRGTSPPWPWRWRRPCPRPRSRSSPSGTRSATGRSRARSRRSTAVRSRRCSRRNRRGAGARATVVMLVAAVLSLLDRHHGRLHDGDHGVRFDFA